MKFCSTEFTRPSFFVLHRLHTCSLLSHWDYQNWINSSMAGFCLNSIRHSMLLRHSLSHLCGSTPRIFSSRHSALNCAGYLQDDSRTGCFTLGLESIHCAGPCNASRAFVSPAAEKFERSRGFWLSHRVKNWRELSLYNLPLFVTTPFLELTTKHHSLVKRQSASASAIWNKKLMPWGMHSSLTI